jgi:hypothetical protein
LHGLRKTPKKIFILFSLFFFLIFSPHPAKGSYLTLLTDIRTSYDGKELLLSVTVTNRGDEPAFQVMMSGDLNGKIVTGPLQESLGVGETYSATLGLDIALEREGQYAAVVKVDYADANRYPFSAISLAHFVHGAAHPSQIFGSLENIDLSRAGKLPLTVKNLDEKGRKVSIRLILPREISARSLVAEAPLKEGSVEEIRFGLKNLAALPGSSYPVYALIEYDEGAAHYTTSAKGVVRIIDDPGFSKSNRTFLIGLAVLFGAGFVYLNVRSFMKKKREEKR